MMKRDKDLNLMREAYDRVLNSEGDGDPRDLDPGMSGYDSFYGPDTVDPDWNQNDVVEALAKAVQMYVAQNKKLADLSENEWDHHAVDELTDLMDDAIEALSLDVRGRHEGEDETELIEFRELYHTALKDLYNEYAKLGGWQPWIDGGYKQG